MHSSCAFTLIANATAKYSVTPSLSIGALPKHGQPAQATCNLTVHAQWISITLGQKSQCSTVITPPASQPVTECQPGLHQNKQYVTKRGM